MDACQTFRPAFNPSDPTWPDSNPNAFGVVNQTVGFLLSHNKDWVIVGGEVDENGQPRDITDIPTGIVLEIEELAAQIGAR